MTGAARITVRGTFVDDFGAPVAGKAVGFRPSYGNAAVELANALVITASYREARTDAQGQFSVQLWATDDDRISPVGWTYEVIDPAGRRYPIVVPKDAPGGIVDLADLVPVAEPHPGVAQLLAGPAGAAGPRGYGIGAAGVSPGGHLLLTVADPAATVLDAGALPSTDAANRLSRSTTAATALSGHRVVTPLVTGGVGYADNLTAAHRAAPLWLTDGAAASGAAVTVTTAGPVVEPSWSWTPGGALFLGGNGVLTQTPPSAPAFLAVLGTAITATSIYLDRQPSIVLV